MKISDASIEQLYAEAENWLQRNMTGNKLTPGIFQYASPIPSKSEPTSSFHSLFSETGRTILSREENDILLVMQRGLAIGLTVADHFVRTRGHGLAGNHKTDSDREIALKELSWIVSFYLTGYIVARENVGELDQGQVKTAVRGDTNSYLRTLSEQLRSRAGVSVVDTVKTWAKSIYDELNRQARTGLGSLFDEFSTLEVSLESEDFRGRGFDLALGAKGKRAVEMVFKKPEEIIGNAIAKQQAIKLAKMLASYDFTSQKNPFVELGAFIFTIMGDGEPGTGKTSIIQMTCGLIKDYCEIAGYPYHFENFNIDMISDYQGRSAQNTREFISRILDPSKICFGTIDDIDQIAARRDNERHSSVGQQEVTAVLMNAFAGVDTVVRGNASFGMFSNYPDKVDDALRQRAGARWSIDGPQTEADYIDILKLMIGNGGIAEAVGKRQSPTAAVGSVYTSHDSPHGEQLSEVFARMMAQGTDLSSMEGLGRYLFAIRQMDKRFTGRAVRNIANNVMMRSMDVDLPDEWFVEPKAYLNQSYDTKLAMLKGLQSPVTAQMILQEINRYADSELRFADRADEADIQARIRAYENDAEARARVHDRKGLI